MQILAAQTDGSSLEGSRPADKGKFKKSEKSRIFSFNFSYEVDSNVARNRLMWYSHAV